MPLLQGDQRDAVLKAMTNLLAWINSRYVELSVFNKLQDISNTKRDEVPIETRLDYILSMFLVLLANFKMALYLENSGLVGHIPRLMHSGFLQAT